MRLCCCHACQCHSLTHLGFDFDSDSDFAEALMAYIGIQPELVQELVDLIRVRTDQSVQMTVPLDISVLAVHCLAALVHTRYCTAVRRPPLSLSLYLSLSSFVLPSVSHSLCSVCVRRICCYIWIYLPFVTVPLSSAPVSHIFLPLLRFCFNLLSLTLYVFVKIYTAVQSGLFFFGRRHRRQR